MGLKATPPVEQLPAEQLAPQTIVDTDTSLDEHLLVHLPKSNQPASGIAELG
jgi:hypothetical protein